MAILHLPAEPRSFHAMRTTVLRLAGRLPYLLIPAFWVLGCGQDAAPLAPDPDAPGGLRVEVTSQGGPLPDHYSVLVGETRTPVAPTGFVVLSEVPRGSVQVALEEVPGWCTVAEQNPRTVQVNAGSLSTIPFSVQCEEDLGILARPRGTASAVTIGPDGGEVTATDTDGTQLSLRVPPGALPGPVEIRMTPATMDGLGGVVSSFVGGVIFEPSGLEFQESATFQLTPPGGTEQLRYLAGVTFSADGAPGYRLAELDPTGESLLVAVDHFSGTAVAELIPGAWGDLMEIFDQVPHAQPVIEGLQIPTGVDQLHTSQVCVRVVDGSGRPHPRVPVSFQAVTGPVRGFVPVEAITDVVGVACARVLVNGMDLEPEGEWVVATAVVFPGAGFESTLQTYTWVLDQNAPFGVDLDEPVNVVSDVPFEVCTAVANLFEPDTRPVGGVTVHVEGFGSVFSELQTGADGRGCTTGTFRLRDDEPGQEEVTIRARVRQLNVRTPPTDEVTRYDVVDAERTFSVERAPLRLELQAPAVARFGEETEICAVVTRGTTPEDRKEVLIRLLSGPGTFPGTGGDERLGGLITGTRGPGRGCASLLPGDPEQDENLVFEAFTYLRGGEELVERGTIQIQDNRPVLTLTATPSTLTEGGGLSRICASLRDESQDRQMPGASVRFVFEGPGVMAPPPGEVLVTDEDGLACVDYTAPDPLPDGTTTFPIGATAVPLEFEESVAASVTLTLEEPTRLFSLTATPASISIEGGESQLCGFLRLASDGSPVVGAAVRFSHEGPGTVAGAFMNIPTNGDGLSCTTYTAPTPLPDGETPVTILAVATPSTATDPLEATTVVRLGGADEEVLEIVREPLRPAVVDQIYVDTVTATGGDADNRWFVDAGVLPPGIQLGNLSGRVIGTPTAEGDYPVRFRVTNGERSDTATLNIEVRPPLAIATDSLPAAVLDAPYATTLQVSGGPDEVPAWGIASGSLPPGLTLSVLGRISGTPQELGDFPFVVRATAGGVTVTRELTLSVISPIPSRLTVDLRAFGDPTLTVGATDPPLVFTNQFYSHTLRAIGPSDPDWTGTVSSRDGLISCSAAGGVVSGTCEAEYLGSTQVVLDAFPGEGTITEGIGSFGCPQTYSQSQIGCAVTVIEDTGVLVLFRTQRWSIVNGSLPDGLEFDARTGRISGFATLASPGTYTVTFRVTAGGQSAESTVSFEVF